MNGSNRCRAVVVHSYYQALDYRLLPVYLLDILEYLPVYISIF